MDSEFPRQRAKGGIATYSLSSVSLPLLQPINRNDTKEGEYVITICSDTSQNTHKLVTENIKLYAVFALRLREGRTIREMKGNSVQMVAIVYGGSPRKMKNTNALSLRKLWRSHLLHSFKPMSDRWLMITICVSQGEKRSRFEKVSARLCDLKADDTERYRQSRADLCVPGWYF